MRWRRFVIKLYHQQHVNIRYKLFTCQGAESDTAGHFAFSVDILLFTSLLTSKQRSL